MTWQRWIGRLTFYVPSMFCNAIIKASVRPIYVYSQAKFSCVHVCSFIWFPHSWVFKINKNHQLICLLPIASVLLTTPALTHLRWRLLEKRSGFGESFLWDQQRPWEVINFKSKYWKKPFDDFCLVNISSGLVLNACSLTHEVSTSFTVHIRMSSTYLVIRRELDWQVFTWANGVRSKLFK